MPSDTRRTLRDLGVALLNATLLLIVAALFLAVTLVVQVRGLANDLQTGMQERIATLQPQIEAARTEARAALDALESAAAAAPGAIPQAAPPALTELRGLVERLETLTPAAPQTDPLLRQIALAIIATAARGLLAPAP